MSEQKSLFELIEENITDGKLKDDFSLPQEKNESRLHFVDGGMDGICIYHMGRHEVTEEEYNLISKAVSAASDGNYEETNKLFAELGEKARAVQIIDEFQDYVRKHADEININNMYSCAFDIITKSAERESIKFSLEIMELIQTEHLPVSEVIRKIGLSDEFTIFSAWIMREWENGSEELFNLAKKVSGWGRVHIIDMIEPDTEEIRNWLLTSGTKNDIVYAYSAFTCWEKSQAEEKIKGELSLDEFAGVLTLIDSMLDEGPVMGISRVENADEIVSGIVNRCNDYEIGIGEYETVKNIQLWAENKENPKPLTADACKNILSSEKCKSTVKNAVKNGKGIRLAKEFGIEYKDDLIKCLEEDFENNCCQSGHLMNDEKYIEKVVDLYRRKLPFDKMVGEPETHAGEGENFKNFLNYEIFIPKLYDKPLVGEDLVINGIKSISCRCRKSALDCVKQWIEIKKMPLAELSENLYSTVTELEPKEPDESVKTLINEILSAKTDK